MSKPARPFITPKRVDSNTFQLTLNPACGLPQRVCNEWKRRSFQDLPDEFAHLRVPKTKAAAQAAAFALVAYLKKKMEEEGSARRIVVEDITVGAWIEKFTTIETSPRTGVNASRNRPYSTDTLQNYESYFRLYIKEDPIGRLKMAEVEEQDVLEYMARLSVTKLEDGRQMGGTRTYAGVVGFMRMTFRDYQKKNRRWYNPFLYIDAPQYTYTHRDALPEDEILKLFTPGVLKRTIELGVCAAMFLSGLRRAEVAALKPEDLDWKTPKINIRHAWQNFDNKEKRVLGPPKSKHYREAPFDPILQAAITKLWEENGKHEFVFSHKNGKPIGPSWTRFNFNRWLERAGIELDGREIVPHSSRHSLATLLEEKGVSLRHIQELLGHSDLETTKGYLHTNRKTLLKISQAISEVMESETEETQPERSNILGFKVS